MVSYAKVNKKTASDVWTMVDTGMTRKGQPLTRQQRKVHAERYLEYAQTIPREGNRVAALHKVRRVLRELHQQELQENTALIQDVQTTSVHRLQTALGLIMNTVDQLNAVSEMNSENKAVLEKERNMGCEVDKLIDEDLHDPTAAGSSDANPNDPEALAEMGAIEEEVARSLPEDEDKANFLIQKHRGIREAKAIAKREKKRRANEALVQRKKRRLSRVEVGEVKIDTLGTEEEETKKEEETQKEKRDNEGEKGQRRGKRQGRRNNKEGEKYKEGRR